MSNKNNHICPQPTFQRGLDLATYQLLAAIKDIGKRRRAIVPLHQGSHMSLSRL